jgi:WD40 repeat protein
MKTLVLVLSVFALVSCKSGTDKKEKQQTATEPTTGYSLELVWESDTLLRTPESVLFNRDLNLLYVANVNLNPWETDGNGFISQMDLEGNITNLKWIEGLSGPKGMGVSGNELYIADIVELVIADIETGDIIDRIPFEGDPNINDITVGDDGAVYISGSASNIIYKYADGQVEEIFSGTDERFNGLYWEKDRMLLITSGSSQFMEIDWLTKEPKVIAENMGHGDGIAPVGDGGYLTSSWAGALFYVSPDGIATKLLDTEAQGINTADIDYSIKDNLLFVPTFYDNRVKAYRLVK